MTSREEQLEEIVAAVGQTFLGLTVQCARCHNHKFDPISQVDYYRVKSVFEGVNHGSKPRPHGVRRLLSAADEEAWQRNTTPLRGRLTELEAKRADVDKRLRTAVTAKEAPPIEQLKGEQAAGRTSVTKVRDELTTQFPVVLAYAGDREQPKPTVLFARGHVTQPCATVSPCGLSAIGSPSAEFGLNEGAPEASRRWRFAEWLTDPANPLTARVMVNRL